MTKDNLSPPDDVVVELFPKTYKSHRKSLSKLQNVFQLFDFILPNGEALDVILSQMIALNLEDARVAVR